MPTRTVAFDRTEPDSVGGRPRRFGVPVGLRTGVVLGCGLFLAAYGIGSGELHRNEGLRALVAAEALRTGRWLVPTLHGEPFLTKPPGMTAAIALCSRPGGRVSEVTARLPSVIAALLALGAFAGYFRRQFGARGGLAAAAILPASLLWLDRTPSAEIDMLQLGWVTGAVLCFLMALESAEAGAGRGEWAWWLGALLCVAGGFLTKWTAPAFFYLTAVPVLWRRGRLGLLAGRGHVMAAAVAGALCLAWVLAAANAVGWPALFEAVRREALLRLSPRHHPRPYPWGEVVSFPLGFLGAALPWSAFALVTLHPGFARAWDGRAARLLSVLHAWLWVNLLFWAVVPGHRPRHCLPLQPAVAGLAAMPWIAWLDGRRRWRVRWCGPGAALAGILAFFVVVKLGFVHRSDWFADRDHGLRGQGARLSAAVPAGEPLFLCRLKDEGLLFYYGRPTRRLADPEVLARRGRPAYCLLTACERRECAEDRPVEEVTWLHDGQGEALVLVKWP